MHCNSFLIARSSRKVTYHLFDITKLKEALEIQDVISLKEEVLLSCEVQVANNLAVADPIEAKRQNVKLMDRHLGKELPAGVP